MSKPQEILELEAAYGITLEETKDEKEIMYWRNSNLYFLNDEQEIIGLNLNDNQISKIEHLEKLTNLSKLGISNNDISKIENLEKLTNLSEFDISNNNISKIESLENLTNLLKLYISSNHISKIENLEKLTNLSELYISYNKISKLEYLETLTNLLEFDISNNNISKIESLENLTNLLKLYISSNHISKIENLEKLTNLSELDFSSNQISKIENLESLTNLSVLNISYNEVSDIKIINPLLRLNKLKYLNVSGNPFIKSSNLNLNWRENHLDIVKSELQKLKENQINIELPVKVMLLGNHASGKSTLLKYLQTQQHSEVHTIKNTSTNVLSVVHSKTTINYNLPKAIFYDFGGQDYYHGVHRAFFTQEAVNILVWNAASDENKSIYGGSNKFSMRNYNRSYWLAQLKYVFFKQYNDISQYTDPLLLIQTYADIHQKNNWKEDYNAHNIVDEFYISLNKDYKTLKNEASLKYVEASFWHTVTQHSEEKKVPVWFPEFLSYIINKKSSKAVSLNTIIQYYKREVTADFTEKDREDALRADLEQLSRKGILLYYKNDPVLKDVAWLNPEATVTKIHETILNKNIILKYKGRLTIEEFEKLNIDSEMERLLLTEKILFFDKYNKEYIIPNYLPLSSEDDVIYNLLFFAVEPTFILQFKHFIPFGLINQLICHFGQNLDNKYYWRDQLIFTLDRKFKVWIQLDFSKLMISVSIKSIRTGISINKVVQRIFQEIMFLYWGKEVPPIIKKGSDELLTNKTTKNVYNEIGILALLKNTNIGVITPSDMYISVDGKNFKNYNLLINPNIKKMKKIFISYSRKDVEYKDELRKHLNILKLFDIADNWSCEDITIGKWHNQIQYELHESDMVIFMLSINFFNSKYILEQEVHKTMDAIADGSNKKVYCIVVSEFPGLENFNEENMLERQKNIAKLGTYQYGMYTRIENRITGNKEEKLITLKEASRLGILDEQLTKIVNKILRDI
ncbi:internalin A [Kordia periserrulae]|uniref:Internalin A n=1 Tax=Kordia periserrulae TaxID=701523 RepID=A0A2T6C582_9FLAO|nr:leucine-rich repeat domain-containing protein [Kordia periserrulae]PTX63479.1 internalin A [Kordia periserrulae]